MAHSTQPIRGVYALRAVAHEAEEVGREADIEGAEAEAEAEAEEAVEAEADAAVANAAAAREADAAVAAKVKVAEDKEVVAAEAGRSCML